MTTRQWHDSHYEQTTMETHPQHWRRFTEVDPFNPENRVEGYIQMKGGDHYGALDIREVNGKTALQFLTVTPKTSYPFFKDGTWVLQNVQDIQAYLKLDGTNICQFAYHDAEGKEFTSFKVRIRPFMAPFFINLMNRCLKRYPSIRDKKLHAGEAVIYELYGYMTTQCSSGTPTDIDLAMTFGQSTGRDGSSPSGRSTTPSSPDIDCPRAPSRSINARETTSRREYREPATTDQRDGLVKITDEQFDGEEGEMLYATFANGSQHRARGVHPPDQAQALARSRRSIGPATTSHGRNWKPSAGTSSSSATAPLPRTWSNSWRRTGPTGKSRTPWRPSSGWCSGRWTAGNTRSGSSGYMGNTTDRKTSGTTPGRSCGA